MRQKKKTKVEVLRKKLAEIDSGKWRASDEDKNKLKQALIDAEMIEPKKED